FPDIWKVYNPLFQLTSPDVYFVTLISDEMRFDTQGWDAILMQYKGYYPDDIFRLRCSQFRFRNYVDFWQCGFVPDSIAFYTRKWLSIQGDWNPCGGPDSFQQCVAFYMFTYDPFSPRQFHRDIVVPNLDFSGEGASIGMSEEALRKRLRENNRAWFTLMSHAMQEEAKRRAMCIISHIVSYANGGEHKNEVTEEPAQKYFLVCDKESGRVVERFCYGLSWLRITFTNLYRAPLLHYYCGGGRAALCQQRKTNGIRMVLDAYYPTCTKVLVIAERLYDRASDEIKKTVKKLLRH